MSDIAKLESDSQLIGQITGNLPELFVINLCASMAPMPAVPKTLKGFEKYKLYQVSRQEDGRRRFRLRLGFFTNEADAEWVLNSVRGLYPTAFTGCLSQEDLRFAGDALPPLQVVAKRIPEAPVATKLPAGNPIATPVNGAAPPPAAKPPVTKQINAPVAVVPPTKPQALSLAAGPVAAKPEAKAAATAPAFAPAYHVARGVDIPDMGLELTDEHEILAASAAQAAARPISSRVSSNTSPAPKAPNATASTAKAATANPTHGPILGATVVNPPKTVDDYVPILDTTLTIRTLTKSEAEDPNRPKWYAVQLAKSGQPINLETMPKLDIFAAYSLYCVALMEDGKVGHALRLGFFRENVSAEAVMGYLKAFFPAPALTQISAAEHDRFAESKPKAKPSGETDAKIVSLSDKRPASASKPPVASPAPVKTSPANNAARSGASIPRSDKSRPDKPRELKAQIAPLVRPQSFLSRLIGRQLD